LLAHQARRDLLVVLLIDLVRTRVGEDLAHLGDNHGGRHAARHFAGVVAAHAVGEHHQAIRWIRGDRILVMRAHHARVGAGGDLECLRKVHVQSSRSTPARCTAAAPSAARNSPPKCSPVWKRSSGFLARARLRNWAMPAGTVATLAMSAGGSLAILNM